MQTLELDGRRYVVVPEEEYRRMATAAGAEIPPFPEQRADGNYPAIEAARASIARTIIRGRSEAGWSQAELARRAKIQPATLNRIERAKVTADQASVARIARALKSVGVSI